MGYGSFCIISSNSPNYTLNATSTILFIYVIQDDVARCFEYYADLAEALDETQGAPLALPMETFKCHILKEPIGIVGLISPW